LLQQNVCDAFPSEVLYEAALEKFAAALGECAGLDGDGADGKSQMYVLF